MVKMYWFFVWEEMGIEEEYCLNSNEITFLSAIKEKVIARIAEEENCKETIDNILSSHNISYGYKVVTTL